MTIEIKFCKIRSKRAEIKIFVREIEESVYVDREVIARCHQWKLNKSTEYLSGNQ